MWVVSHNFVDVIIWSLTDMICHDRALLNLVPSMCCSTPWKIFFFQSILQDKLNWKTMYLIYTVIRLVEQQKGSHLCVTYRSVGDRNQVIWLAKIVLGCLIILLKLLIHRGSKGKSSCTSLENLLISCDLCCLEFVLIPWSGLNKYVDHLIPSH